MSLRIPVTVSIILVAVMAAMSVWGYHAIPDGTRIAVHWGLNGQPNGFMPKDKALIVSPAIAVAVSTLMAAIPYIEPRRRNLAASRKLYFIGWIGALCVMTVMHCAAVLSASGVAIDTSSLLLVTISLLISFLGNYIGKSRATFFIGMRLPWTLTSDLAWEKSNRLLGRIFVVTGLIALASGFGLGTRIGLGVLAAGMVLGVIAAGITSYVVWKHDPERETGDSLPE
ncbi:MAG: SdpI family protein [Rhizomicrobium sp.]